jgi:CheY-like chemotaxis protein
MQNSSAPEPLRILIVDDSPDHATSLASLLVARGHTVQIAYSSLAALEQAEVYQADVVLLDIGLPDLDGYELALRLRELLPSAMLMAVSGHAGDAFQAKARAVGIAEYFVKPVAVAKLREVLDGMTKRS